MSPIFGSAFKGPFNFMKYLVKLIGKQKVGWIGYWFHIFFPVNLGYNFFGQQKKLLKK